MNIMTTKVSTYAPSGSDFLSGRQLELLTAEKIITEMQALAAPLRAQGEEAEDQRRPIDAIWDKIRASGYFYMLVPRKFGGLEASIDEIVDASLPIARGCASTGWVAMFGLVHNRHMVGFPTRFQEEIFGDGRYGIVASATIPVGKAEVCEGGYRLSGRWRWATCVTQADWVMLVAEAEVDGQKITGSFMVPASDVSIIDTWKVDGMCATGTHDVEAQDLFVPDYRATLGVSRDGSGRGAELFKNPIYRVPLSPLLAFTTAVPLVGAAQGAVELYRARLHLHTKRGTEGKEAGKVNAQIRLAQADTMVAIAEQIVRSAMKENLCGIDLKGDEQAAFRSRLRAQFSYAARLCREAVLTICESSGTSIHFWDNPLQRIFRDVMVMTSHVIFDYDVTMEQHGRGMLGLPPNTAIS